MLQSLPAPFPASRPQVLVAAQPGPSLEDLVYRSRLAGAESPLGRGHRAKALGLSLVVYGALGTGLAYFGARTAGVVAVPRIVTLDLVEEVALLAPPPPPPPAPAIRGASQALATAAQDPQPVLPAPAAEVPAAPSQVVPPAAGAGHPGGAEGGVSGGVAGGAAGGVVGGTVGGVVPPRFDAAYLQNPAPDYPSLSRRLREEGRVVLRVLVNEAGSAERIELRQTSGHARLDQAALDAVRRWRFTPARRGSEHLPAWVLVPLSFSLDA